jgi:glucokinase
MKSNNMRNRFLVGDIGGTKTALAIVSEENLFERVEEFSSNAYTSFESVVLEFLKNETVSAACFGVAGPIENKKCKLTNLSWEIDGEELSKKLKVSEVFLLNDLVAAGYGIKNVGKESFFEINRGRVVESGTQAVISPGTGLGEAFILRETVYQPVPSEGGHADFAPRNDLEIELFCFLRAKFGHVSYERVLSGGGLSHLYEFFSKGKKKEPKEVTKEFELFGFESDAGKAISLFCEILGAEAANLALKTYATGGVFIGGGVSLKLSGVLKKKDHFMRGFLDKGRFSSFLKNIPVNFLQDSQVSLKGCSFFLQKKGKKTA